MLMKQLREQVLEANLELVQRDLVLYTFGNASGLDREQGLVVIKPPGVDYENLKPEHMVVTDLHGKIVRKEWPCCQSRHISAPGVLHLVF